MLIVSEFKDYYDRHYPGDQGAVYVRKTLRVDEPGVIGVTRKLLDGLRPHSTGGVFSKRRHNAPERTFEPVVVSFCGRPVVRYREAVRLTVPFWDPATAGWNTRAKISYAWFDTFEAADAVANFGWGWGRERAEVASAWSRLLAADTTDLHHALQTPLVAVYVAREGWGERLSVERDPFLKGMEFGGLVPADQCYQAIEQFVEGVLSRSESYPRPSDRVLIESKGFDPKWSFRNPDPPRRKRKKR